MANKVKQSKKTETRSNHKQSFSGRKILAVAGIAGIAAVTVACMRSNGEESNENLTNTPLPTQEVVLTQTPEATATIAPTSAVSATITNSPTPTIVVTPEATPTKEATPTPTPVPTPAVTAEQALKRIQDNVDTKKYNIQLINDHLRVGNGEYYQFGAIFGQEFLYPFLVVDKSDGTIYCYDSNDQTVFDFSSMEFPIIPQATATPTPTKTEKKELTAKEAYEVLCTYSKESLKIAKAVKEYDAEYGEELTLIDGNQCYRINLSEVSGGKVRNRGEFYVSVDGTKCYYIDSDTNEFILANK